MPVNRKSVNPACQHHLLLNSLSMTELLTVQVSVTERCERFLPANRRDVNLATLFFVSATPWVAAHLPLTPGKSLCAFRLWCVSLAIRHSVFWCFRLDSNQRLPLTCVPAVSRCFRDHSKLFPLSYESTRMSVNRNVCKPDNLDVLHYPRSSQVLLSWRCVVPSSTCRFKSVPYSTLASAFLVALAVARLSGLTLASALTSALTSGLGSAFAFREAGATAVAIAWQ